MFVVYIVVMNQYSAMSYKWLRIYVPIHVLFLLVFSQCLRAQSVDGSYADVLYSIFMEARNKGDDDVAAKCALQYLERVDTSAVDTAIAGISVFLGRYYDEEKFMFSKSISCYRKARDCYRKLGMYEKEAWAVLKIGKLRYKLGRYDKALAYIMEAMPLFERYGDIEGLAECCNVLGAVYFSSKNYSKSNYYASMFEKYSRELNDSALMVKAMNNLAVYANYKHDSLSSRTFISESISVCRQYGDTSMLCNLYLNLAASYLNSGNTDVASRYLELADPIRNNISEDGKYHYLKGVVGIMEGKDRDAETHLLNAVGSYSGGEFELQSQKCHLLLDGIYASRGDTLMAYRELAKYYDIESRLLKEDVFMELFEYQNEIISRNELEKETARRTSILIYGIVTFFTILTILFLLFLLHRTKAKNKAEMDAQKTILEMKKMQEYSMNRLTEEVASRLTKIAGETDDPEMRLKLMCVTSEMSGGSGKDQWEEMSRYVPEFNTDFYQKLIKDFPSLTTNERRLCTLLNLNMSTKEIAQITRQSPHSIKVARYRLRAKLNLTGSKMTIQEFLCRYNS